MQLSPCRPSTTTAPELESSSPRPLQDLLIRRCQAKSCAAPVDPIKRAIIIRTLPQTPSLRSLRIVFGIALFHLANHPFLGYLTVQLDLGSNPPGPFSEPGARSRLVTPVSLNPQQFPGQSDRRAACFDVYLGRPSPPKTIRFSQSSIALDAFL